MDLLNILLIDSKIKLFDLMYLYLFALIVVDYEQQYQYVYNSIPLNQITNL